MGMMTVLAVAVMCDGRLFSEGTPIDDLPPGNRESVRLRYSKDIEVIDRPIKPIKPERKPTAPVIDETPSTPPPPSAPSPSPAPEASTTDAQSDSQSSTPLPAMAEELLVLLKAGGIETVEQATEYLAKNKSFRPLKGVGEAKDTEIRTALGIVE